MIDFILGISALIVFGGGWFFIRRSGVNAERDKAVKRRLEGIAEHRKTEKDIAYRSDYFEDGGFRAKFAEMHNNKKVEGE